MNMATRFTALSWHAVYGHRNSVRRYVAALLLACVLSYAGPASARSPSTKWVATWAQAMTSNYKRVKGPDGKVKMDAFSHPLERAPMLRDATIRQIVHTSLGGDYVRIRLSNYFGRTPLMVSAAHLALPADAHAWSFTTNPRSDRTLTFGGKPSITLAPGHTVTSDPVSLHVPALSNLLVSLYFAGMTHIGDMHRMEHASTSIVVPGDAAGLTSFTGKPTLDGLSPHAGHHIYVLDEVDVTAPRSTRGIVAFGDSITDGSFATAPDKTWPAELSALANGARGHMPAGVVNAGISGNELTVDQRGLPGAGVSGLKRFERDVIDRAGVTDVVVLFGANDLNRGTDPAGYPEGASAGAIIAGYRMLVDVAHAHHLRIYAGTVTPFAGYPYPGWYSPTKEAIRKRVNHWVRTSGAFDGVIAFSRALTGRYKPAPLAAGRRPLPPGLARVCAGDQGLHPNDRGYAVMGTLAYDKLFRAALKPASTCH